MQPCLAISYLPVPGGRVDEDEEVLDVLVGEGAAEEQLVQDLDERHEEVLVAAPDRVAVVQLVHLVDRKKITNGYDGMLGSIHKVRTHRGGGGRGPKSVHSKGGCVNLVLRAWPKCVQGGEGV